MNILFSSATLPSSGTLVVTVAADRQLGPSAEEVNRATGGMLTRAMTASRFTGKKEETLAVLAPSGVAVDRILLLGLGKPDLIDELSLQQAGGAASAALDRSGAVQAAVLAELPAGAPVTPTAAAACIGYGALLRSYRFDRYKTTDKPEQKPSLKEFTVLTADADAARRRFQDQFEPVAEAVTLTRDLVSEPANVMTPLALAERAWSLAALGVKVEVLDRTRLESLGMRALLGVAQGSANPPCVVVMSWLGDPKGEREAPLAVVGKGVTFDTGGISIKPAGGMEDMKWDMAGAATVIGLMHALARRRARFNVVGVVGLVENMPSATAQRPGDIVRSLSGLTIEVINTDAEGRLVLADVLWYTQDRFKPRSMIDLATLTGAVIVALGHENAGLFANDDELAEGLTRAGQAVGERLWRLPMAEAYEKDLSSDAADLKNVGSSRDAGSILGAQFLQRFVNNVPWAHLDIAGVAWLKKDTALAPKGSTGFGVRLLDRLIADLYEPPA